MRGTQVKGRKKIFKCSNISKLGSEPGMYNQMFKHNQETLPDNQSQKHSGKFSILMLGSKTITNLSDYLSVLVSSWPRND